MTKELITKLRSAFIDIELSAVEANKIADTIEALKTRVAELEKQRDDFHMGYRIQTDIMNKALVAERDALAAELAEIHKQEPVSYRYKFTHPISGEPVWRDSSSTWNGQCVQEVQQLFAAPILPVREPDWLLKTTQDLARAIARGNFPDVPQWEVFDDLPGVISQIDNMVCGMERKKPVREPLSDNTIAALRQAIAQPATTEWTVIAPDGTRFTGPTPLKAALPASKYRLEIDPVAAVKFMEIIDQEAEKGRQEAEQCMRDYGTLDCPTGKGHHKAEIVDATGRKLVYVLASSNSDHRAVANRKRDISRFFKEQAQ